MTKLKVDELRKAIFENKQKLIRGEFKDTSFFKKTRKEIARLLAGVAVDTTSAGKVAKKKEKVVDAVVATDVTADAPKKIKKAKAKKEEQ